MKIKERYVEIKRENYPDCLNEEAVLSLIERVAGKSYARAVRLEKLSSDGFDRYEIEGNGKEVVIRGTSGVACAAAFNRYLRDCCGYAVGILTTNGVLPKTPPKSFAKIERKSPFLYRYFFNYCTFGYTYAFDDWADWEKTSDYLLLSGYNLILNPIGLETAWRNTLLRLGYTEKEADEYLCGPAFYPWQWMMNMSGWASGAPSHWYDERAELCKKFNERLYSFGVNVVSPGFAGSVPDDFKEHFPDSSPVFQGKWQGFDRPSLLLPEDSRYDLVCDAYYEELRKVNGGTPVRYYAADPFHEGGISDGIDLDAYGKINYRKMCSFEENVVWIMQGWSEPKTEILRSIPDGNIMVLALYGDTIDVSQELFANVPWCYCTVNNFGGQYTMQGYAERLMKNPHAYLQKEGVNEIGIGYMPEGVADCEVLYEILAEDIFSENGLDKKEFLKKFLSLRYGAADDALVEAWESLVDNVLCGERMMSGESGVCMRPTLNKYNVSTWALPANPYASQRPLLDYVKALLCRYDELFENEGYKADLTDGAAMLVGNLSWYFIAELNAAYAKKDAEGVSKNGAAILKLCDLQAAVVSCSKNRLLGVWLEKAKRHGKTSAEQAYFEWNARMQITLWGQKEGAKSLHDYAAKEWDGLIQDFYKPRWEAFVSRLEIALLSGKDLEEVDSFYEELPFTYQKKSYPVTPYGDLKKAAQDAVRFVEHTKIEHVEEQRSKGSFRDNVMNELK